jgi:hypothetical protein
MDQLYISSPKEYLSKMQVDKHVKVINEVIDLKDI